MSDQNDPDDGSSLNDLVILRPLRLWGVSFVVPFLILIPIVFLYLYLGANKTGVVLQLIAGLSVLPQALVEDRRQRWFQRLQTLQNKFGETNIKLRRVMSLLVAVIGFILAYVSIRGLSSVRASDSKIILIHGIFFIILSILEIAFFIQTFTYADSNKWMRTTHLEIIKALSKLLSLPSDILLIRLTLPLFIAGCIFQLFAP